MEYLGAYASKGVLAERIVKAALVSVAVAALLGAAYYVFFRNWREERHVTRFFRLLQAQRYADAYVLWGCTEDEPCRYYPYEEFLEDWGPEAPYGTIGEFGLGRSYTQANGVIVRYSINGVERPPLWIELDPPRISFAPQ